MEVTGTFPSPCGRLRFALRGATLTRLEFRGEPREGDVDRSLPEARALLERFDRYFTGELDAFDDLDVDPEGGTPFQREVWAALRTIAPRETRSYADIAEQIGKPLAVRAVGAANGKNPVAIVVPCHRVIGKDKTLTGFGGGLPNKAWLLTHEGVAFQRPRPRISKTKDAPEQHVLALDGQRIC